MATAASPYLRHRFPPEIIAQCVLLYMRFPLSFRAVEEAMLLRGVQVSYETIRRWCQKFGQQFANELHRRRPRPGDKWLATKAQRLQDATAKTTNAFRRAA